jgi:hypothetical protein
MPRLLCSSAFFLILCGQALAQNGIELSLQEAIARAHGNGEEVRLADSATIGEPRWLKPDAFAPRWRGR